jgi:hypothetical protein
VKFALLLDSGATIPLGAKTRKTARRVVRLRQHARREAIERGDIVYMRKIVALIAVRPK